MLSSIFSTILTVESQFITIDFHLKNVYTPVLSIGIYVLGLGLGHLYLAPLSELRGRRIIYIIGFSLFTIFIIGCAISPNIVALSVLRFFSAACVSAGPTLGGASLGDMFSRGERGRA